MAIDYVSGSGLFDKLGKLIKWINSLTTALTSGFLDYYTDYVNILDEETDQSFVGAVTTGRDSARTTCAGFIQTALGQVTNLLNKEIVPAEGLGSTLSQADAITKLRFLMGRDAVAVLKNTVSVSGATASAAHETGSNTGNGTVALTVQGLLTPMATDGTPATIATEVNRTTTHDAAEDNQFVIPDSYELRCTQDAGSVSAGSEIFTLMGSQLPSNVYDYDWKHAGTPGTYTILSSTSSTSIVGEDGGFETIDTGTPNGWTISVGTPNTHFIAYTSAVYRGAQALRVVADASTSPAMLYDVTLNPGTKYLIAVAYKRLVAGVGTCTLTLELITASGATGPTWTPSSSEKATVNVTGTDGSYTRIYAWVNTPDILPSATQLKVSLLKGSGGTYPDVAIDEVLCCAITPTADGLYVAPMAGSANPIVDDRWTFSTSNNFAGLFQSFFGRFFKRRLPAVSSSVSTSNGRVDDTLASA